MMTDTPLDLSAWLARYKATAPARRAARHQATHRPRPQRPPPPRPEPPRFSGSHVARLRAMGAAHPTPRRGLGSFPRGKGIT